mgnify:CR=1 FL=1
MAHAIHVRVVLAVVAAGLMAAAPVTAQREVERTPLDAGPERLAILPFGNISGAPGDDWIGAGIAETLMVHLQGATTVDVIAREAVSEAMREIVFTSAGPVLI